jgi:hypothetical protein
MIEKKRKGQVTIFIIIALIIVVLGVVTYMFYPKIKSNVGTETKNPEQYIRDCIKEDIEKDVELISLQGGSLTPEHIYEYEKQGIQYLCYTNEYYRPCLVQQPLLKSSIEKEIEEDISSKVKSCFNSLEENYLKKNYDVNIEYGNTEVQILPKKISTTFNHTVTLTKKETETYDNFIVTLNNDLYELLGIADSILEWESTFGDAETTIYMSYYHDLKVEKRTQSEGTVIYILTNKNSLDKFQFASRSVVWPPGYI